MPRARHGPCAKRPGPVGTVKAGLGTTIANAYDRAVNREGARGEFGPVDVLRTVYLFGKLLVLGVALLVLLLVLGVRPRRRVALV